MGADWIPVQTHLRRRREVLAIASATGRSVHEVAGLLLDFWGWLSEETTDGRVRLLSGSCPAPVRPVSGSCPTLGMLVSAIGADDVFWQSVADTGWLRLEDDGLSVPHWDRWLSKSAKARALDTLRKRAARLATQTCPDSVRPVSGCEPDKTRTTVHRQRHLDLEEKDAREKTRAPPFDPTPHLARWNGLARRFDLPTVDPEKLDPKRRGKLRAALKAHPDLWDRIEAELPRRSSWWRERRMPNLGQLLRPDFLAEFLEGSKCRGEAPAPGGRTSSLNDPRKWEAMEG